MGKKRNREKLEELGMVWPETVPWEKKPSKYSWADFIAIADAIEKVTPLSTELKLAIDHRKGPGAAEDSESDSDF